MKWCGFSLLCIKRDGVKFIESIALIWPVLGDLILRDIPNSITPQTTHPPATDSGRTAST